MTLDHTQIPDEILSTVFEIGILTWDIRFLPPLCLVCKRWNVVVVDSPRLWGIITINRGRSLASLEGQITKAKASPLTVFAAENSSNSLNNRSRVLKLLVDLCGNWVSADVSTDLLYRCRWSDMRGTLEKLTLSSARRGALGSYTPDDFFSDIDRTLHRDPPRLRSFTAKRIPKEWIQPFLSPSITHFGLILTDPSKPFNHWGPYGIYSVWQPDSTANSKLVITFSEMLDFLRRVPQVVHLTLQHTRHFETVEKSKVVSLNNLAVLDLEGVLHPAPFLCEISAPSLKALSIRSTPMTDIIRARSPRPELALLSPFFSQWSHGIFLPAQLHTLELVDCLQVSDVAYLIRWLARLPSLVRLTLRDDAIGLAADLPPSEEESNIFRALASPEGAGPVVKGWLCPALAQLRITTDLQVTDLIPIGRARGRVPSSHSQNSLRWLCLMEAFLCTSGSSEDIQVLERLVDVLECGCLGCGILAI